jgi:hypothetical protein
VVIVTCTTQDKPLITCPSLLTICSWRLFALALKRISRWHTYKCNVSTVYLITARTHGNMESTLGVERYGLPARTASDSGPSTDKFRNPATNFGNHHYHVRQINLLLLNAGLRHSASAGCHQGTRGICASRISCDSSYLFNLLPPRPESSPGCPCR